jgi:lipopolysaccharide assembly outer membrane protein LptD (OstA)
MMKRGLITSSLLVLFAYSIFAQSPVNKQPGNEQDKNPIVMEVKADSVTLTKENDGEVTHYTGRVETQVDDVTIQSERLTIYHQSKKLVAEGNVAFTSKGQTIKATSLEWGFTSKPSKITFVF